MVVDTSAVLAILFAEPEAADYAQLIEDDPAPSMSATSVVEAGMVLTSRYGPEARDDLRDFIEQGDTTRVSILATALRMRLPKP